MEDRPVQEGYHRPARKKKRAGLPAFFLAVIVLALLAAVVLRIWLGYRSGSLAAGDITVLLLGAGGGAARPLHRSVRPAPRRGELRLSGAGAERGKPFVPLHR